MKIIKNTSSKRHYNFGFISFAPKDEKSVEDGIATKILKSYPKSFTILATIEENGLPKYNSNDDNSPDLKKKKEKGAKKCQA